MFGNKQRKVLIAPQRLHYELIHYTTYFIVYCSMHIKLA